MVTTARSDNWIIGTSLNGLGDIHQEGINISIWERGTAALAKEVHSLLERGVSFRSNGKMDDVLRELELNVLTEGYHLLFQDIKNLLLFFKTTTNASSFRILLTTVNKNMCRRYHTDINDIRLLCTYHGPGTLWLKEDNINRRALDTGGDNQSIVIDENDIQQVKTGSVVLLKGAIYPKQGTRAIVHRSPTIEESGETRLLLRIDTNDFLNFE